MLIQVDKLVQLIESPVFTCKFHAGDSLTPHPARANIYPHPKTFVSNYSSRKDTLICTSAFTGF